MFEVKKCKAELELLCDFTEIYDSFRLINQATCEVYSLVNGKAVLTAGGHCYHTWNRDAPCANCVSRRACRDNAQRMKLEYMGGRVLMVIAKPVVIEGEQFALELVTDVTGSMVVQDEFHLDHEQIEIGDLIEKVNQLSVSDVFTGLYNNAYMKNKIGELAYSPQRQPFSILILDIDRFKQVNDHYGHLAGDAVIQTIAAMLKRDSVRPGYSVGRMGGDEYCVVLENCGRGEAERYAQQAAREISTQPYEGQGEHFTVEVTIGVGEYAPGEEMFAFIERVDHALYAAKHIKEAARLGKALE